MLQTPAYQWSRLIGYVDDARPSGELAVADAWLGQIEELPRVLDDQIIDEVILVRSASETGAKHNWGDLLQLCLERGRTVSLVDDIAPAGQCQSRGFDDGPDAGFWCCTTRRKNPLALAIKNVMDRVLAAIMLVILAPLFAVVGLLIKLHDKGPVFYSQKRVGLNGAHFQLL